MTGSREGIGREAESAERVVVAVKMMVLVDDVNGEVFTRLNPILLLEEMESNLLG